MIADPTEADIEGGSDLWKLRHRKYNKPLPKIAKELTIPDHMKSFDELNYAMSPTSNKSKVSIRSKNNSSFYKSGFLDNNRKKKPIEPLKRYTD